MAKKSWQLCNRRHVETLPNAIHSTQNVIIYSFHYCTVGVGFTKSAILIQKNEEIKFYLGE